ncbi:MAG: transposase, partial [Desulfobulbus sp.]|nr:transposase [Desulfobulbus sp.]
KTALGLARAYDFVAVEDLNIKAMQRLWGRKISDLGHGSFLGILDWMLRKHGGQMVKIDRFYPSSKQCSVPTCLHILPELPLQVRS